MSARAIAAAPSGATPAFPCYTRAERMADGFVHALGVGGSLIAVIALLRLAAPSTDAATLVSLAVYGFGVVAVFSVSAAYHMIHLPSWKSLLRRLDHAAIFLKIAGTYTPFALISIGGGWGAAVLGAVWSIAAVGVPLKLWAPGKFERSSIWLYLGQGWVALIAIGPLTSSLDPDAMLPLLAGGLLYTVGVFFHLAERLPFHNAIWHAFVLVASGCMYAAVLNGVALPVAMAGEAAAAQALAQALPLP